MKSKGIKVLYVLSLLLQIALVLGAFILNFFATTRMGMKRWLNYKNNFWQGNLPLEELKIAVLVMLCVATLILVLIAFRRLKSISKLAILSLLILICGLVAYSVFIFTNNVFALRSYYYMLPFFSLALLIQVVKSYIFMFRTKVSH